MSSSHVRRCRQHRKDVVLEGFYELRQVLISRLLEGICQPHFLLNPHSEYSEMEDLDSTAPQEHDP